MWNYEQAAAFLGIPVGTLYSWVSRKQIPFFRYGPRLVRFAIEDLNEWKKSHRVQGERDGEITNKM